MFRKIKVLHCFSARYKSVKIVQVDSKSISKADRIKKLHYENKYMYGAKINEKIKKISTASKPSIQSSDGNKSKQDISSEIYWTCLHVPEVMDFTKPKKVKTKKEPPKKERLKQDKEATQNPFRNEEEMLASEVDDEPQVAVKFVPRKAAPKKIIKVPQLPESLNLLQAALPEVKWEIKNNLDQNFKLKVLQETPEELEIPFGISHLRTITSFPMILSSRKTDFVDHWSKTLEDQISYLPSVSKVLQGTMPEPQRIALMNWKNLKITELGLEGFELMQQSHLRRGKQFHQCLQRHFSGETVIKSEISSEVVPIWESIEPLLDKFQAPGHLIEQEIEHPYLRYKGIVDCVSFHNSELTVIEWKKSDRQKKSLKFTYDAPVQLCSYLGALNASRQEFIDNPIKSGVIVVAYNDGQKADLFELNEKQLQKHWTLWLHRLQEYWVRYRDSTLPDPL